MRTRNRAGSHSLFNTVAVLLAAAIPVSGRGDSGGGVFNKLFGSHMNDVAVKIAELPEPTVFVTHVEFNPDATHMAVKSTGENIDIWDWRQRRIEKTIEEPKGSGQLMVYDSIRYSPDGKWLANCDTSGSHVAVRIWRTSDWSIAKDIVDPGACMAIGFALDSRALVMVNDEGVLPGDNVVVINTETWQPIWSLRLEKLRPTSLAASPDGKSVAVGGGVITVPTDPHLSDIERLQQTHEVSNIYCIDLLQKTIRWSADNTKSGFQLTWSPDGKRIARGGRYDEIFDAQSGRLLQRAAEDPSVNELARYTADGRYFIESDVREPTGESPHGVLIWDSEHRRIVQRILGYVGSLAVSRDGKYLAVGGVDHVTVWQFK